MKEYHKNPRKISDQQLKTLKDNIKELGDLSGITHELNTDQVITGNQRSKLIDISKCKIEITFTNETPDKQGTLSLGRILTKSGEQYNYRSVKWNEDQIRRAAITANSISGEWDESILKGKFSKDSLSLSGFDDHEIKTIWDVEEVEDVTRIKITIAGIRFEMDKAEYDKWERKMLSEFKTDEALEIEILKRLGI